MAASLFSGLLFVILPNLNLGLLSDYKICGDSECESPMSRVQAIRDHSGKDCRFLSFRRGDIIVVYHKLTGKREDLWAGSIDKQFGYFPKDAVREEHVHATTEKVVATQESDFFCVDEFGYLTDSSHLEHDDGDGKIPSQETETIQNSLYTDDKNAESPSESDSAESEVSAQEASGTSTEEGESKNAAQESAAALNIQGGSASAPWLGSSVTGWLGLGGQGKPDEAAKSRDEDSETADSFTSTMTQWLGFGGKEQMAHSQEEEKDNGKEQEPAEKFRSRRMSLDLEGSQLPEEEREEVGTLEWLGKGLSNKLGLGLTNQEAGRETTPVKEEEERPASWFNMEIGDILGFKKDKNDVDESTGSGSKEEEKEKISEQTTGLETVNTSQSEPALTEVVRTEASKESEVKENPKDQNVSSEIETVPGYTDLVDADSNKSAILVDTSDKSKDSVSTDSAASKDGQEDISPQNHLEAKSQVVGGISSMLNRFFRIGSEEEEEDNVLDDNRKEVNVVDGERFAQVENKDHQPPISIENVGEDNKREPGEEGTKTMSDTEQGLWTQPAGEEGNAEVEGKAEIPNQLDNTEEPTDTSFKVGTSVDNHIDEGSNAERDLLQKEQTLTAQSEETSVDHSDSMAMIDNKTEAEPHQGESGQEGEIYPEGSSQEFGAQVSVSTTQLEDDADRDPVSLLKKQSVEGAHMLKEMEKDGKDNFQPVKIGLQETIGFETETEEVEEQGKTEELKGEEEGKALEVKEEKQEVVEEINKMKKQEEEIKEEETHGEEEGLKDEMVEIEKEEKQAKVVAPKGEEKQEEVEELKGEEKQRQIDELNEEKQEEEVKETKEEERREEETKKKEKNVDEDKESLHHSEAELENSPYSSPPLQTDTDRPESEMDGEKREGENTSHGEGGKKGMKGEDTQENVEDERRDKEGAEEGKLKCSNELCPQASVHGFVGDRDGNDSATRWGSADGEMETGEKNVTTNSDETLADGTGGSHTVPSEGMEGEEDTKQEEEQRNDDETVNSDSNITGNEDIKSPNANSISDPNALEITQIGTDYNLVHSAVNKDDQLNPSEAKNAHLSDLNMLHQGAKTKAGNTDHMTDTDGDTGVKRGEVSVKEEIDVLTRKSDEFSVEAGTEISSSDERLALQSDQAVPQVSQHLSGVQKKSKAVTEREGAFGLFQNVHSFFSQTPGQSLDPSAGETSEPGLDSATQPTQQQPSPPPFLLTPTPSQSPSPSASTGSPLQTKALSKHYKSLLAHLSVEETTILTELFGPYKLQFLDYILGSSETVTKEWDNDKSILLDIERLLHYHREALVAPSMRLADAPQEDKEKTRMLIALQKVEMLLARVQETFNPNHQAGASCFGESCSAHSEDRETASEGESSTRQDNNASTDERKGVHKQKDGQLSRSTKERGTEDGRRRENEKASEEERVSPVSHPHIQPGWTQPLEGTMKQIQDFVRQITEDSTTHVLEVRELLIWLTAQVVSALPDDIRPGPDLYGVPWEPVIISSLVGLMTMLLFTCRCYSSVKSRMYRSKERWMAEQVALLLDEKCKVLETLSKCQQEYDELESSLRDSGVLAQTQKTEHLEGEVIHLGHVEREMKEDLEQLKDQLDQQREHRRQQERRIATLEESIKDLEEETKDLQSQDEQAQTTLKVYNMNSDRLQKNLETAGEEKALLQESNAQLRQQVEGWAERVSELEADISRCEVAHSVMQQDVANKDERIMSLIDGLLRMKAWDSDLEEEDGGEEETSNGTAERGEENGRGGKVDTQNHLQKVQKLIYAAKLNADLKSVDEDKDRAFAKLNDEIKAKEDLLVSIKELENEKLSLQSDTENYSDQVQRLQQKLHIMTEMYQENELKLHRLLTVEEKERLQKEEKLNKADKNIALAIEELNNYRQRAAEMEEELEKTKQSYQTQISAHEKKAHNNWLAARAADRELADIRRENALMRQKLTDTQFKLDALDKDPYALDSLARPLPFRAERSPYGPSPLGRPASETRAFLSPPTLMDELPTRLSPRAPRGPVEPPGGQGEMERSGGPHSDSGSNSPTWDRDRRGPPPGPPGPNLPPGYMFPEPGAPMYRRALPPPGALGYLPPPGSLPPAPLHLRNLPPGPPHPADMADGTYRENSLGPGEQEHRESGPGDRRTPPEASPRIRGAPPPGPPLGPRDGPFPRRAPYGLPPPDFYPPRGPGGPPMMPMWAPPPPGVMFPPRFPPGGPPLPHHPPPMRPPLSDGLPPPSMGPLPPQQTLPSPPHSQSLEEHKPSPEDAI